MIPFEERFEEDILFGASAEWLIPDGDAYRYYRLGFEQERNYRCYGIFFNDEMVYSVSNDPVLLNYGVLAADGRWGYLRGKNDVLKIDLLTGEYTVWMQLGSDLIFWSVYSSDRDTLCLCTIDDQRNMRIYYRDIHSDAEKTLYEGILPMSSPKDLDKNGSYGSYLFTFTPPRSTQGAFSWRMTNPAFYAAVQKELADPDSPYQHSYQPNYYSSYWRDQENRFIHLSSCPGLCHDIQDGYKIPYFIKYIYSPATGTITEDYGYIDSCYYGSGYGHDHFNAENTWETPVVIVNEEPVVIPTFTRLTEAQAYEALNSPHSSTTNQIVLYSEQGYDLLYVQKDGKLVKLADIPCRSVWCTKYYVYAITADNTLVQISWDGTVCNTIYTAEDTIDHLVYNFGRLFFEDNHQVVCIDTVNGTRRVVLKCTGSIYLDSYGDLDEEISVDITQGLYYQQHFYNTFTGELEKTSYL